MYIATAGCVYDILLMVSGSERGKIVIINWDLDEDNMPYFTKKTFLDWYEDFFRDVSIGKINKFYSY